MAEQDKKVVTTDNNNNNNKPIDLREQATQHLKKCRDYQLGFEEIELPDNKGKKAQPRFIGKPGYNPYLYCVQVLQPWEAKIESGQPITNAEYEAILKIPIENPPDGKAVKITNMNLAEYIAKANEAKAAKKPTI